MLFCGTVRFTQTFPWIFIPVAPNCTEKGAVFIFLPQHSPLLIRLLISSGENWAFKSKADPNFTLKFKWEKILSLKFIKIWWHVFNSLFNSLIALKLFFLLFYTEWQDNKKCSGSLLLTWYKIMILINLLLLSLGTRQPVKSISKMWGTRA